MNFQTFSQVAFAFAVTPELLVLGLIYALVMGLIGGLLPAVRAARLPIPTACASCREGSDGRRKAPRAPAHSSSNSSSPNEPRRVDGPERFAVVVERKTRDVTQVHAARRLRFEHDEHGASAVPSRNARRQPQERRAEVKPFSMTLQGSYYRSALISFSKTAFGAMPMCRLHTFPSFEIRNDAGMPQMGPYASCMSSRPRPSMIG